MERAFQLGKLSLRLQSEKALRISDKLQDFMESHPILVTDPPVNPDPLTDSRLEVQIRFQKIMPQVRGEEYGRDLLSVYYREEETGLMTSVAYKSGRRPSAVFTWSENGWDIRGVLEDTDSNTRVDSLDKILQLLPLRSFLIRSGTLMLHSSRIGISGKAILFTAPSQTGKTTQARLWEDCRGAQVLCNDRTLIWAEPPVRPERKPSLQEMARLGETCMGAASPGAASPGNPSSGDPSPQNPSPEDACAGKDAFSYRTSNYIIDGSSPVETIRTLPLAAIVVLGQAPDNSIRRLRPSKALRLLTEQTVLDAWDPVSAERVADFWMDLFGQIPVYELRCTPDENAVQCLQDQLIKDGIFHG